LAATPAVAGLVALEADLQGLGVVLAREVVGEGDDAAAAAGGGEDVDAHDETSAPHRARLTLTLQTPPAPPGDSMETIEDASIASPPASSLRRAPMMPVPVIRMYGVSVVATSSSQTAQIVPRLSTGTARPAG